MPTAKQFVALEHETLCRTVEVAPAGFPLGTIDQFVPFHRSIKLFVVVLVDDDPTAKQLVGLAHETPFSVATMIAGSMLGLGRLTHALPFHRSNTGRVTAPPKESPTAKQLVVAGHATARSSLREAPVGGAVIDHAVPFQRSASVTTVASVTATGWYDPTEMQPAVLAHDTPSSDVDPEFAGLALGTIDQLAPSHCSANVRQTEPVGEFAAENPTAEQLVALKHETSNSCAIVASAGVGLPTIDQVAPSQRSVSVFVPEPGATYVPTAKQVVALSHDTPASVVRLDPPGCGAGTIDQLVPFHCSTSGLMEPAV